MKLKYKNLLFVAALLGLTGCNGDLDIQNPNGFSDDDITEKILNGTDEAKKKLVLEGMVNNMQNYILSANAQFANGFSNSEQYEYNQELWRSLQVSDMVEGSEVYKGSWVTYYTNDEGTLQWWNREQPVSNYGYYLGPVYRISAALHPLLYINKTDSAVRITHLPTGLVVECQDERSQHRNKERAMSVLLARLTKLQDDKRKAEEDQARHDILSSGDRSDRIRTYNFPQGRVTDHRINLTLYRLDEVLNGDMDPLIGPVIEEYQADQLQRLSEEG